VPRPITPLRILLFSLFLTGTASQAAEKSTELRVGSFTSHDPDEGIPHEWQPLTFKKTDRYTRYRLVKDGNTTVVEARSQDSASGLTRKISIDPKQYRRVRWSWKVSNRIPQSDPGRKEGDDYPARLYITFADDADGPGGFERLKYRIYRLVYGKDAPLSAISYIWGNGLAADTVVPNAYTDRVMMIVTQNETDPVGRWVWNERNIYDDYIRAFGKPPPMISGIAIMTDTDNTGDKVTAHFGDIAFISMD
jgi:hypothetical protein